MALTDATRELYQSVVMAHHRDPSNHGELAEATHRAHGDNPLCGDRVTLTLRLDCDGETIERAMFVGEGCAISRASGSLLTEAVEGRGAADALALAAAFAALVDPRGAADAALPAGTDDGLAAFRAVRAYPGRVGCATLAWDTFRRALRAPAGAKE